MNNPTRSDYMAGRCSFEDFYRAVNQTGGVRFTDAALLVRVRKALAAGDKHLNTIPLATWDAKALGAQLTLSRALRAHGDFYSLAGGVCCMKQAARDAAERETA